MNLTINTEDEFVEEQYKEENCECGLTDDDTWSEAVFERFGCTCNGEELTQ